jgi:imidazolonepropionase-like amidohydrolase
VTSVLVAQSGADEDELAARAAAGAALSPHLFRAGPGLTAPGGHPIPFIRVLLPWPLSALVIRRQPTAATPAEAEVQVARIHDRHRPPLLKIFYDDIPRGTPHLSREVLEAAVRAARARGMRPVVHIGGSADMVTAAEAGAALLMHPPLHDVLTEAQVARLRALGVPFVTTLRMPLAAEQVGRTGGTRLEREVMDPRVLAALATPPREWALKGFEDLQRQLPAAAARARENVRRLVLGGVLFFVGTDAGVFGVFPGASLHGELIELARLGLPPLQLLRAVTSAPAAFLDPARTFGRVAPGQRADLLLVRGDPLADLGALADIEEVFLAGARLERVPVAP